MINYFLNKNKYLTFFRVDTRFESQAMEIVSKINNDFVLEGVTQLDENHVRIFFRGLDKQDIDCKLFKLDKFDKNKIIFDETNLIDVKVIPPTNYNFFEFIK